jgi:hypothetical protein
MWSPRLKLCPLLKPDLYTPAPVPLLVLYPPVYQIRPPLLSGLNLFCHSHLSGNLTVNGLCYTYLGSILSDTICRVGSCSIDRLIVCQSYSDLDCLTTLSQRQEQPHVVKTLENHHTKTHVVTCIISFIHICTRFLFKPSTGLINMVVVHRQAVSRFFHLATAMSVVMAEISCYTHKKVLRLITMTVCAESRKHKEETSFLDFTAARHKI